MEAGVAIHTAARRYCLERYALWAGRYAEIARRGGDRERDGYRYTSEALARFPRYNVLNAIRVELERIHFGELRDFDGAKARVLRAGEAANDDFTRKPIGRSTSGQPQKSVRPSATSSEACRPVV